METFGRYELLRKIAIGGMGAVYLARQKGPVGFQKLLVVKRLLPHLSEDDEFIEMFLDEGRIAAHLNHPNIAQIYDLGDVDGQYFIAMEYVHGEAVGPLGLRAQQRKLTIPLGLKCRIIADAAAGLDAAHNARSPSGRKLALIHRDVSPQNVLVGYNGGVKLIDFGVAKASGKFSQTVVGTIKGKHAYMSPEQARGEPLDHRSDIFGLGTVFYELLTHQRLFKRDTEIATLKAVVGTKIVPPSEVMPDIPKELDAIVLKALARKREERFASAGEVQLALDEFLVQQKLHATPAHLAAFMQDTYSEELEEERLAAEPTVIHYDPRLAARQQAAAAAAAAGDTAGSGQRPTARPTPAGAPARKPGGSSASAPAMVKDPSGVSASSTSPMGVPTRRAPTGSSAATAPVAGRSGTSGGSVPPRSAGTNGGSTSSIAMPAKGGTGSGKAPSPPPGRTAGSAPKRVPTRTPEPPEEPEEP
ncbi:protein kinase [Myxococcus sp. K38C18041901]|uniref:serine/threonine protein kinase n=1 Tax=Myxococcus guangdongensis TaxID=2906760 RepID=UPI0020A78537|nr:protein kinase [Myxococcus guangdongensis]MCP3062119.1 protein kinase [Myxococcus guangdongensis]